MKPIHNVSEKWPFCFSQVVKNLLIPLCLLAAVSQAQENVENFESGYFIGPNANWPWRTGGNSAWGLTAISPRTGTYCAQSGNLGHSQTNWAELRLVVNTSANISFWFKTSTETNKDVLRFLIDGVVQTNFSGNTPWSMFTSANPVGPGPRVFRWEFVRDASGDGGNNLVWIDDITLPIADGITIITTNGPNTVWHDGDPQEIKWRSIGAVGSTVKLEYSTDNKASWTTITNGFPNASGLNSYTWTFPPTAPLNLSTSCFVRVTSGANPAWFGDNPDRLWLWPIREDFETGNFNNWPWRSTWWQPWDVSAVTPYHGAACARRTYVAADASLSLKVEVKQAGFVGFFFRKTTSEQWFRFKIDGIEAYATGTSHPWTAVVVPVTAGVHTLEWMYDLTSLYNDVTVYVDAIHFPADTGIVVCEPNGTDPYGTGSPQAWLVGDTNWITWHSYGNMGSTVTLQYSEDGRASWKTITDSASNAGADGVLRTYPWVTPNIYGTCWIRIIPSAAPSSAATNMASIDVWGQDDGFETGSFTKWPWQVGGSWVISSPAHRGGGAATYAAGTNSTLQVSLTFDTSGFIGFFARKNGDSDVFRFRIDGVEQLALSSSQPWLRHRVPITAGTHTLTWEYSNTGSGTSIVAVDAIGFAPLLELTEPLPSTVWDLGSIQTIRWTNTLAVGATVSLDYTTNAGLSWLPIDPAAPNDGEQAWVVAQTPSQNVLFRASGSRAALDQTVVPLTIRGTHWLYPNGGEALRIGSTVNLLWESASVNAANVLLEYSTDGKGSWKPIEANTPNDGSHAWIIPNEETGNAFFRLTSLGASQFTDVSDAAAQFYAQYDLEITSISVIPSTANLGEELTLSVTVHNRGSNDIAQAFFSGGWQDLAHNPSPGEQEEFYWHSPTGLAAGATTNFTAKFTPSSPGVKTARALVDSLNWVAESNEGNNTASATYTVNNDEPLLLTLNPGTTNGQILLQWRSVAGRTYDLLSSTNMQFGFALLRSNLPATPPKNSHEEWIDGTAMRVFKLREKTP